MTLGERIRIARKRLKMSQRALAKLMDIEPQAVSQWETDKTGPKRDKMPQLARFLQIEEHWLWHGQEPLPPLKPDDLEIFVDQLINLAKAIPATQRGPAIQILRALVPTDEKPPKPHQRAS